MSATREEINHWIETAKKKKCQFILSVCDRWEYDDYPIYCKDFIILEKEHAKYDGINMQRINEIIQIKEDKVIENLTLNKIIESNKNVTS